MCLMDFDKPVTTSQVSIHNQTNAIMRRFCFTCDVAKSECSIFDRTMKLHGNDSHLSVSSEPLVEDKGQIQQSRPNFVIN